MRRQPLAAQVAKNLYRNWWPADSVRYRKRAKRRSAKRERQQTRLHLKEEKE